MKRADIYFPASSSEKETERAVHSGAPRFLKLPRNDYRYLHRRQSRPRRSNGPLKIGLNTPEHSRTHPCGQHPRVQRVQLEKRTNLERVYYTERVVGVFYFKPAIGFPVRELYMQIHANLSR